MEVYLGKNNKEPNHLRERKEMERPEFPFSLNRYMKNEEKKISDHRNGSCDQSSGMEGSKIMTLLPDANSTTELERDTSTEILNSSTANNESYVNCEDDDGQLSVCSDNFYCGGRDKLNSPPSDISSRWSTWERNAKLSRKVRTSLVETLEKRQRESIGNRLKELQVANKRHSLSQLTSTNSAMPIITSSKPLRDSILPKETRRKSSYQSVIVTPFMSKSGLQARPILLDSLRLQGAIERRNSLTSPQPEDDYQNENYSIAELPLKSQLLCIASDDASNGQHTNNVKEDFRCLSNGVKDANDISVSVRHRHEVCRAPTSAKEDESLSKEIVDHCFAQKTSCLILAKDLPTSSSPGMPVLLEEGMSEEKKNYRRVSDEVETAVEISKLTWNEADSKYKLEKDQDRLSTDIIVQGQSQDYVQKIIPNWSSHPGNPEEIDTKRSNPNNNVGQSNDIFKRNVTNAEVNRTRPTKETKTPLSIEDLSTANEPNNILPHNSETTNGNLCMRSGREGGLHDSKTTAMSSDRWNGTMNSIERNEIFFVDSSIITGKMLTLPSNFRSRSKESYNLPTDEWNANKNENVKVNENQSRSTSGFIANCMFSNSAETVVTSVRAKEERLTEKRYSTTDGLEKPQSVERMWESVEGSGRPRLLKRNVGVDSESTLEKKHFRKNYNLPLSDGIKNGSAAFESKITSMQPTENDRCDSDALRTGRNRRSTPLNDGTENLQPIMMQHQQPFYTRPKNEKNDSKAGVTSDGVLLEIEVAKGGLGLGFCIEGGKDCPYGDRPITVKRLFRGSVEENNHSDASLKPGDEIISANECDMTLLSRFVAWNFLKSQPEGIIRMFIKRRDNAQPAVTK